ncbi:hypothetical protein OsJ_18985 [Oryza sativa Japonica Group]|uniref:Uncharacterized protein n=1 Tax=Oryza sativa subsp. japonica TaxID=39947 RepID=B9FKU2_ORYSJ|nr:hypothetical protein OsJ_18985 [Oryza sativa Japonica Group]
MQDSLGLMQFLDHHQYLYSSSSSNLPLQQPLLSHHHRFLEANEGCAGEDDSPEFVEPPAAAAAAGTFEQRPELGACKEVYSEEGGAAEERTGVAMAGADVEQVAVEDEEEAHGVRMIALLMECAAAMSVGNLAGANGALLELSQMASPYAASCGERLVAYFARAMAARLAILEAFHGKRLVHIVDLDVVPGGALQWLSLLPALAARPGGPPVIRVTGFGMSASVLHDTGNQLAGLARKLCMFFEFYAVAKRPGDADAVADMPGRRPGEAVAVHWLRHAMREHTAAAAATGRFLDRFVSALHHYSAVFEAMGASRPDGEDASRHLAEHGVLGREIANVLAVGGPARSSGREGPGSWREVLARHGFAHAGGGGGGRAQLVAAACPGGLGYTVAGDHDGTVRLGWKGTPLYAVSAWTWCSPPHARA